LKFRPVAFSELSKGKRGFV